MKTENSDWDNEIKKALKSEMRTLQIKSASLLAISSYIFYNNLILSFVFALSSLFMAKWHESYIAVRNKRELTYQFKDALYAISISLASGRPLKEALAEAHTNTRFLYGDNARIVMELKRLIYRLSESNEMEEQVLHDFSRRCDVPEILNFTEVYLIARKTGGDMGRIIMKTSEMIIDKISIEREISVMTAQKRFEGQLLILFPFIATLILKITSPEYIKPLYETGQGRIIMTVALFGIISSKILMDKINDIRV